VVKIANLSLGTLCASYVFVAEKFHSLTQLSCSGLHDAACWLAKYTLSQHLISPARLEKYWSVLRY
jgi:hypothetical protein